MIRNKRTESEGENSGKFGKSSARDKEKDNAEEEKIAGEADIKEDLKNAEKLAEAKERKIKSKVMEKTLVPLEDYVRCGIHLGTKVITPHMREFVYRRRADSLAVLNTNAIDEKLKKAAEFLSQYKPEDVIIVCKREAGWNAAKVFSEVTGIRAFTKKYPAGIITNTSLPNFFEVDLIVISDPWLDKNALKDAKKVRRKVLGLCDTNNLTFDIDVVIPCNNKSSKSLGLVYYILAREYLAKQGKKLDKKIDDFIGEELVDKPEEKIEDNVERQIKAKLRMIEAREGV